MANSNYPFGTPLATIDSQSTGFPLRNGQVIFVDGSSGSDGEDGTTADVAVRSLTRALALAQAGDIIMVALGTYDENVVVSKDYITMIGCGISGYARPNIAPTAGIALSVGTAQGFVAKHLRFVSADSDSVVQKGNGFLYEDCVFDGDSGQAATEANLRLVGDADDSYTASEGKVLNCLFRGSGGAGIIMQHAPNPSAVGTTDNEIAGCRFVGNTVDILSAVNVSGGGSGIYLNLSLHDNQFMTVGAAYVYIDMAAGAVGDLAANSGLMSNNFFADEALIAGQIVLTTQPNVMFAGNYDAVGLVDGSTFNN